MANIAKKWYSLVGPEARYTRFFAQVMDEIRVALDEKKEYIELASGDMSDTMDYMYKLQDESKLKGLILERFEDMHKPGQVYKIRISPPRDRLSEWDEEIDINEETPGGPNTGDSSDE